MRGDYLFGIEAPLGMALNNLVLPLAVCAVFFGLIHERTRFRRLLETRLFQLLGKSSYAFYLVHIGVVEFFLSRHLPQSQWVRFGLTNVVAIALFKLVEEPAQRALKAWKARGVG